MTKKNILLISSTLIVLNEDIFIDFKDEHPLNNFCISLTWVVLIEDKSIDSKDEQ